MVWLYIDATAVVVQMSLAIDLHRERVFEVCSWHKTAFAHQVTTTCTVSFIVEQGTKCLTPQLGLNLLCQTQHLTK